MRILLVFAVALCAWSQPAPFTLDQVLSAAFPSDLTAAPTGGKVAWVSDSQGVRNLMVAEPPAYKGRKVTNYTEDDGQELLEPCWTPDASAIVYVRGSAANRAGENPNPTLNTAGATEEIWIVSLDGPASKNPTPRRIGSGSSPAVSPKSDRIAYTSHGQLWWAPLDGTREPTQIFKARGQASRPVWSPDGARLAFTSGRGDHAFIAVYDVAGGSLRYLDPSTDSDREPEWSPDGRSVAFLRVPSSGLRAVREARRAGEPWSIRIASAETGAGRELWRAKEGPGSVFRDVTAPRQLQWADGGRILFPWEGDGWTHLYSVPVEGGKTTLL